MEIKVSPNQVCFGFDVRLIRTVKEEVIKVDWLWRGWEVERKAVLSRTMELMW